MKNIKEGNFRQDFLLLFFARSVFVKLRRDRKEKEDLRINENKQPVYTKCD
jgi:hypothetical protein